MYLSPTLNAEFVGQTRGRDQIDRRKHQRFSIAASTQYVLNGIRGQATTTDLSSGGVHLKSGQPLPVGRRIQLWIDWPVLLENRCPLRLVISGKTIRSDSEGSAIKIIRYDFKIRPKTATHAA